ncbi:MAG: diaminopimelate epimerase [Actinomycetota bacterium]|nr:diaminopimelate epimerase [Actinomycetota bacterium]
MRFYKYHGTGNDFIIIDAQGGEPLRPSEDIIDLCRRHTGIGADGVIFATHASQGFDAGMRIFNADGGEAEMCGNGIRCLAKYLYERKGLVKDTMIIETVAGPRKLRLEVERGRVTEVEVEMGVPEFAADNLPPINEPTQPGVLKLTIESGEQLPAVCLSMGNPHCVLFVEDTKNAPVVEIGPQVERHHQFPDRVNVGFAQLVSPHHLLLRVWERGVGETAACGTGACAAFVAAVHTSRGESPMRVRLPGGELRLKEGENGHVFLAGQVVEIFVAELGPFWRGE